MRLLRLALVVAAPGLVHHSDRGVQYASQAYTELLIERGIRISMSRKGNPYDNANAESFMKTLKYEEVYRSEYRGLEDARRQIRRFIEAVYNRKRLPRWRNEFLTKKILATVTYFASCFALLSILFPIRQRVTVYHYSWRSALTECTVMTLVVTIIVAVLVPLVTWWCVRLPTWIGVVIRTICVFAALVSMAVIIGTSPDLINQGPTHTIAGFFAEWLYLVFIYQFATIAAVLAAGYYWWTTRPGGAGAIRDSIS